MFRYRSASISRAFVNVNPSCFQGRFACPLPALSNRHFIEHVHLQAAWLPQPSSRLKTLQCDHPMLGRANHRLIVQEEHCSPESLKFACGFFTSTLARRYLCCLLHLCCNCIPQEISSCKSSMLLCSFLSRCSGHLLFREASLRRNS